VPSKGTILGSLYKGMDCTVARKSMWTTCRICENACMFPGRQIKYNLPWSSNSKCFHPPSINASCFFSGASVNVWTFFKSCVWVPKLSSVWKDGSQNHSVTAGKGSNMQKMLENWRICRTWRIFLKNRAQFNCSGQTRDSWTTITKQKNSRR